MKKVFLLIIKTLGIILLVGIVVFICFGIFGSKTNHAGNWQVVKIDNLYIGEDVSMTYSFFADDVATQIVMSGDKVEEIRFFKLKRDGDNLKLTMPDKPGGKSYQITLFENEEGNWMSMKSRTESLIMKRRGGYLVSGLSKSDAEFLYKPHLFVEEEKDKKDGTVIQFFPNNYCKMNTRYGKERYYKFDYDKSENCLIIHMKDGEAAMVKLLSKESCILYDKNDYSVRARIYPFESWSFEETKDVGLSQIEENKITFSSVKSSAKITPQKKGAVKSIVYEVGDFYSKDNIIGVVFDVDETGKHGKIVEMYQSNKEYQWCKFNYDESIFEGATSKIDGWENMLQILKQPNFSTNYPAFAYCAEKGEGWYLPAENELKTLIANKDIVNATLVKLKGHIIRPEKFMGLLNHGWYWSSTESSSRKDLAWRLGWDFETGVNIGVPEQSTYHEHSVRAIRKF